MAQFICFEVGKEIHDYRYRYFPFGLQTIVEGLIPTYYTFEKSKEILSKTGILADNYRLEHGGYIYFKNEQDRTVFLLVAQ